MKRHWEVLCDERMSLTSECKLEGHRGQGCECSAKSESEPQSFCLSIGRMHQRANEFERTNRFRHWWLRLEAGPPGEQLYKRVGIDYFHRSAPNLFDLATRQAVTII